MKLVPENPKIPLKLSLEGMNCVAVIQHTEAQDEDIRRLEKIDIKVDSSCSICLEDAVKPHELKCQHIFCHDCISAWLQNNRECPICRAPV
jgi:hypothetical protein